MNIQFDKDTGLIPAIIQDFKTKAVLMMAYMNAEAYQKTLDTKRVTFFSRSRNRLWTKGEISGNYLELVKLSIDCDGDTFLVEVTPSGPVCHTGEITCWGRPSKHPLAFLSQLETTIKDRKINPSDKSYTTSLFNKGLNAIAQKVGEEAVELIIQAKDNNAKLFDNEAADLMYHLLVLFQEKNRSLADIVAVLEKRHVRPS